MKGKPNLLGNMPLSPVVENMMVLLCRLDKMIDDVPPIQQPQRFGNQAFRTWYQRLNEVCNLRQARSRYNKCYTLKYYSEHLILFKVFYLKNYIVLYLKLCIIYLKLLAILLALIMELATNYLLSCFFAAYLK